MRPRTPRVLASLCLLITLLPVPARATAASHPNHDDRCVPAAATADPVGTTPCFGARPGAYIEIPNAGSACTLGFLFRDARGRSYMSTAGHCVLPAEAQKTWVPGAGPAVFDLSSKKIGTIVFAARRGTTDFALMQVDKSVKPVAQVCHFGGPVGINDERRNDPAILQFYGQATGVGEVVPARSGLTTNTRNTRVVYAQAPVGLGDSGGPWLTDDGRAVGYLTHILGYGALPTTDVGLGLIRRLAPQLAVAEAALRLDITLVTAHTIP